MIFEDILRQWIGRKRCAKLQVLGDPQPTGVKSGGGEEAEER